MKRFHVHVHVQDLAQSVRFYSALFDAQPTRQEGDYAKWMLQDPPVNFAISCRGGSLGIDHLGFQTDSPQELAELKARAEKADLALFDEGQATCCYARSEKHWVTDPQHIAWEHFHTLGNIPVFREEAQTSSEGNSACCPPSHGPSSATSATPSASTAAPSCNPAASRGTPLGIPVKSSGGCC